MPYNIADYITGGSEYSDLGLIEGAGFRACEANVPFTLSSLSYYRADPTMTRSYFKYSSSASSASSAVEYTPKTNTINYAGNSGSIGNAYHRLMLADDYSDIYLQMRVQSHANNADLSRTGTGIIFAKGSLKGDAMFSIEFARNGSVVVRKASSTASVIATPVPAQTAESQNLIAAAMATDGVFESAQAKAARGFAPTTGEVTFRVKSGVNGIIQMWIEGVLVMTLNLDLTNTTGDFFNNIYIGSMFCGSSNSGVGEYTSEIIVSKSYPGGLRVKSLPSAGAGVSQQGTGLVPGNIGDATPLYQHQDPNDLSLWTQGGIPGGYTPRLFEQTIVLSRDTTPAYGVDMPEIRHVTRIDGVNHIAAGESIGPERRVSKRRLTASPATGLPLTVADINGAQIGLRSLIPG